jgi:flavorubredoxin
VNLEEESSMNTPYQAVPDIEVLPAHFPIPGAGFLPINAFVIKAAEPVLVDTGMGIDSEEFMKALRSVIDPRDLRWVWLTHDDADHTGSIRKVLDAAPRARLVANALAVLRMSTAWSVSMERVYWINPGESISVGDRNLTAVRPPLFDNPTTVGIYDDKSAAFFSADCFGAIVPAQVQHLEDVNEEELAQGMISWASVDSPWLYMAERDLFGQALDKVRQLGPKIILSAHLAPAQGKMEYFLECLAKAPTSPPFVTPNQEALVQMLKQG